MIFTALLSREMTDLQRGRGGSGWGWCVGVGERVIDIVPCEILWTYKKRMWQRPPEESPLRRTTYLSGRACRCFPSLSTIPAQSFNQTSSLAESDVVASFHWWRLNQSSWNQGSGKKKRSLSVFVKFSLVNLHLWKKSEEKVDPRNEEPITIHVATALKKIRGKKEKDDGWRSVWLRLKSYVALLH